MDNQIKVTVGFAGPQGPKGLQWKGVWSINAEYDKDDVVRYAGNLWIALRANTGVATVVCDDWDLFLPGVSESGGPDISGSGSGL